MIEPTLMMMMMMMMMKSFRRGRDRRPGSRRPRPSRGGGVRSCCRVRTKEKIKRETTRIDATTSGQRLSLNIRFEWPQKKKRAQSDDDTSRPLREFGSIRSLFCDDDDKKREKNEREKRTHQRKRASPKPCSSSSSSSSCFWSKTFQYVERQGCSFFVMMILEAALFRRDQRRESRPTRDAFCTASSIPHKIDLFFKNSLSCLSLSLSLSKETKKKKISFLRRPKIKTKMSCPRDGVFRCGVFFLLFFCLTTQNTNKITTKRGPIFFVV